MKIKTLNYNKAFPIGPFLQEKIGVEMELDETDDWEESFQLAKRLVEALHKDNNPQLYDNNAVPFTYTEDSNPVTTSIPYQSPIQQSKEERTLGLFIKDIESSSDLKILETYKLLVKGKPELESAFSKRWNELAFNQSIMKK